jgi:hypothetical protein
LLEGGAETNLSLEQRQETTSYQGLAIKRGSQVVGIVAAGGDIGDPQEGAEGILGLSATFQE